MAPPKKYPDELRQRAVARWREADPRPPIAHLAREMGIHPEALRTWIRRDEIARGERPEPLFDEGGLAVDETREFGAVFERAVRDRVDVVLIGLAQVTGVGAGDRAFVSHPGDGDGCVETP